MKFITMRDSSDLPSCEKICPHLIFAVTVSSPRSLKPASFSCSFSITRLSVLKSGGFAAESARSLMK